MIAKFMHSDNGTLCISSQIRIKVTYVIPKKKCNPLDSNKKWQRWNMSQKWGRGRKKERNLASLEI